MDKIAVLWLIIGVSIGAVLFQAEISEAMYGIPPTWSWSNFTVGGTNIEADRHNDELTIIAGLGILLTPDDVADSLTITATGGFVGGGVSVSNATATYIITTNGTLISSINGSNGAVMFSSPDADDVFNQVLSEAATTGGLIIVKEGEYTVDNVLNWEDNTHISGMGINSTIIIRDSSYVSGHIIDARGNKDISFRDFTINEQNVINNTLNTSINLRSSQNVLIDSISNINTAYAGIGTGDGSNNIHISNYHFRDGTFGVFSSNGVGRNLVITQSYFSDAEFNAIFLAGASQTIITDNFLIDNANRQDGISGGHIGVWQLSNFTTVSNNYITGGTDSSGIEIVGNYTTVDGNIITGVSNSGIVLDNSGGANGHYATVMNNVLLNNNQAGGAADGIRINKDVSHVNIIGNVATDNQPIKTQQYGLRMLDGNTDHILIFGNMFEGNSIDDILNLVSGGDNIISITQNDLIFFGGGNEYRYTVNSDNQFELNSEISGQTDLVLFGDHNVPTDGQIVGSLTFVDDDSAGGNKLSYGGIEVRIQDPTTTQIDGEVLFQVTKANTPTTFMIFNEANDNSVRIARTLDMSNFPIWFRQTGDDRIETGGVGILDFYVSGQEVANMTKDDGLTVDKLNINNAGVQNDFLQSLATNQINFYINNGEEMRLTNGHLMILGGNSLSVAGSTGARIDLEGPTGDTSIRSNNANVILLEVGATDEYSFSTSEFDMNTNQIAGSMGCSDDQQIVYDSGTDLWECQTGAGGVYTDATRPTCGASTNGLIIFNDDDGLLNICDNPNWELPDGTAT